MKEKRPSTDDLCSVNEFKKANELSSVGLRELGKRIQGLEKEIDKLEKKTKKVRTYNAEVSVRIEKLLLEKRKKKLETTRIKEEVKTIDIVSKLDKH